MSSDIFSRLKSEYELKQKDALDQLERKKSELYKKTPYFKELDFDVKILGVKYNKAILGEDTEKAQELLNELIILKNKRQMLLEKSGYGSDFLEIRFECTNCDDTGYVQTAYGTEKCSCFKQKLLDYMYTQSNLKLTQKENFENFDLTCYPDYIDKEKFGIEISPRANIKIIRSFCQEFTKNFNKPGEKGLYFCGPTGTGKTFMANCVAKEILNLNRTVLYQTAPRLFDIITEQKVRKFRENIEESSIHNDIYNVDLLIIDDLGTEPRSEARYAEFSNILNIREMNNLVKPCKTIISTNFNPKQLSKHYDERIVSRVIGCFNMFHFAGDDIRIIKAIKS